MYKALYATPIPALLLSLHGAGAAWATAPEVRINNTVSVSYSVDSTSQDPATAEAGFVVDRKVDMLVADTGSIANGRPNQTGRELVYKITNEGNAAQPLDIDVVATVPVDAPRPAFGGGVTLDTDATQDPGEYRVYISTDATFDGGDTLYDPTGTTLAATPGAFDAGGVGDEFHVIVRLYIPGDTLNGDRIRFSVKATALDGANAVLTEDLGNGLDDETTPADAVDIVFADAAKTADSEGTDAAEDGRHTDNAEIAVASAELTATKTVTIVNDDLNVTFNCATDPDPGTADNTQGAIPGACLEYTITLTNGASAAQNAQNPVITDVIQPGITFQAFTVQDDWSAATYTTGTRTISATVDGDTTSGEMEPGEDAVLSYRVLID